MRSGKTRPVTTVTTVTTYMLVYVKAHLHVAYGYIGLNEKAIQVVTVVTTLVFAGCYALIGGYHAP